MNDFQGVIIEESLESKNVLELVKIVDTKVEQVTPHHKTPWLSQWTLHAVSIPGSQANKVVNNLSRNLEKEHVWYVDFNNGEIFYVIFRGKIFTWKKRNEEIKRAVINYGLSLGISEYQLDFPF